MPQGTVFKFPGCTDDGTFAVTLNRLWGHTHGLAQLLGKLNTQRVQGVHHGQDVGVVLTGIGIAQHRRDGTPHQGCVSHRAKFVVDLLHMGEDTAYIDQV